MADELERLVINPEKEAERIKSFVVSEVGRLGREGAVIGLSGGLDSSTVAYICREALGKGKILGLILPETDSDPRNVEDARMIAKELGVTTKEIDLTPFFDGMGLYRLSLERMPKSRKFIEGFIEKLQKTSREPSLFALGFPAIFGQRGESRGMIGRALSRYGRQVAAIAAVKTRSRMVFLYYYAALNNYLVVGTSDKTEWSIGYYDGDAIVDIQPLVHLYKTQIRRLAAYLGLPKKIIEKPSSGDIFGKGLANEAVIGLSYELLDSILHGLEHCCSIKEIMDLTGASEKQIQAILQLVETDKIRKCLPSSLDEHP